LLMNLRSFIQSSHGAASKLALSINTHQSLVSTWAAGRRRVPASRCPDIERATGGAVTCEELRPDVDWSVLRRIAKRDPPPAARAGADASPPDEGGT
jgi:DNA-binding transcriptional regulator YdaS (Cro superfamily)